MGNDLGMILEFNTNYSNDEEIKNFKDIKKMLYLFGLLSLFLLTTFLTYVFCVYKNIKNTQYKYTVIDDSSKIDV